MPEWISWVAPTSAIIGIGLPGLIMLMRILKLFAVKIDAMERVFLYYDNNGLKTAYETELERGMTKARFTRAK